MRFLNTSFPDPAANIAFDEVLLDEAETAESAEAFRLWESPVHCVVLGVSQRLRDEVHEANCEADGVPILRRCSGGGCVVQGPGCLNYSLVLSHAARPEYRSLRDSYCLILNRVCDALRTMGVCATVAGVSDIAVDGRKVSGNAQRRRRTHFLHHGTLLYAMAPDIMQRYLREPEDRPQYRGARTHGEFVRTLPLTAADLSAALCAAFDVQGPPNEPHRHELEAVTVLVNEKYQRRDWTWRR